MVKTPGLVGKYTGTFDRPIDQDRRTPVLSLLADLGLKLPHTFAKTGPTRYPWPGQGPKQKPSQMDFIFASHKLHTKIIQDDKPTPATSTDHRPIGLTAHAPYASRTNRRRQFEHLLAQNRRQPTIPTQWEPENPIPFMVRVRQAKFRTLDEVAPALVEAAQMSMTKTTSHSHQKQKFLEGIRTADDPVIKRAFQIQLQTTRRTQRARRENNKILEGARGKDWHFSRETRIPTRASVPPSINDEQDRGQWGHILQNYLQDLYSASPAETDRIHELLWKIQDDHSKASPLPPCNPTELRDLLASLPNRKAAGPDGAPSQLLKHFSFKQITTMANLFTTLSRTTDYRDPSRPDQWNHALAIMIPKNKNAKNLGQTPHYLSHEPTPQNLHQVAPSPLHSYSRCPPL